MSPKPITPETLGPELAIYVDGMVDEVVQAEGSPRYVDVADELMRHYRAYGICIFSDDADVNSFFHWLIQAGILWRYCLSGEATGGPPACPATQSTEPLQDAMAARHWKLAAELDQQMPVEWKDGSEYEDDFCYVEFLRRLVRQQYDDLEALVDRWRKSLEGGSDPRLGVAEAFASRDAGDVEDALRALLQANQKKAEEMADPVTGIAIASDYPFAPNRWISVEGLALLAAVERAGIAVDYELPHCPDVLRTDAYAPFSPIAYPNRAL
jgi:hypothetical protein